MSEVVQLELQPNSALLADERIPRMRLNGKEWPVPYLSICRNEIVTPIGFKHRAVFAGGPAAILEALKDPAFLHDLATIAFTGLQQGHRAITRAQFDEWPASAWELQEAVAVVIQQTGLSRQDAKEPADPKSKPQTG